MKYPNLLIMKLFLNLNLLVALACLNVSFAKDITFDFSDDLLTHQVSFNSETDNITQEEFDKIDLFISQITAVDVSEISILGTGNETLSLQRAEFVKAILTDYEINEYLISTVNTKEEDMLTPLELELLNATDTINEKVVIAVTTRRLVAGSFFSDDMTPGETFNIENLKFDAGLRYVTEESMPILEDLADFLVSRKDIYFTVQGHVCCVDYGVDARDDETGARNLSVMRAQFVHNYLVEKGVDEDRISYEGLQGNYSLGRSSEEDRRVELLIRKVGGDNTSAY